MDYSNSYLDIEIYRGDDAIFVARCPQLGLFCHAPTQEEAVSKLKKDIIKYFVDSEGVSRSREELELSEKYYSTGNIQMH